MSRSAVAMFQERGWTAVINDELIDNVLSLGYMVVGLLCVMCALFYSNGVGLNGPNTALLCTLGFFSGHLMCTIALRVVSSAVATVYVCYGVHPEGLLVYYIPSLIIYMHLLVCIYFSVILIPLLMCYGNIFIIIILFHFMKSAHPSQFAELSAAWRKFHPSAANDELMSMYFSSNVANESGNLPLKSAPYVPPSINTVSESSNRLGWNETAEAEASRKGVLYDADEEVDVVLSGNGNVMDRDVAIEGRVSNVETRVGDDCPLTIGAVDDYDESTHAII